MREFWQAQFKLCSNCKNTTVGFPFLCNLSPKYKFILSYSKKIQKTLKKPASQNCLIFICMKDNQISWGFTTHISSLKSICSTHHTVPTLETIQFIQSEPESLACCCKIMWGFSKEQSKANKILSWQLVNCTLPCIIINDKFFHMLGINVICNLTKTSDMVFPQNFAWRTI